MQEIDTQTRAIWSAEWCYRYSVHIYRDKDSNLIAISYEDTKYSKDAEYDHMVTIYTNVTTNNYAEVLNPEDVTCNEKGHYSYENDEYTRQGKYNLNGMKEYGLKFKKGLFVDKYILVELSS